MTLDHAINVVSSAQDCFRAREREEIDLESLTSASREVVHRIFELENELERERARGRSRANAAPRVEGHRLEEGYDDGGRRDYLGGRPVHAGQPLYLLTDLGWQAVRYESNMPRGPALLYFSLPGAGYEEVRIPVAAYMRLAWPEDVGRTPRSLLDRS
jgi:hypothetical protein